MVSGFRDRQLHRAFVRVSLGHSISVGFAKLILTSSVLISASNPKFKYCLTLYSAANETRPQMIPRPEMIPELDHHDRENDLQLRNGKAW